MIWLLKGCPYCGGDLHESIEDETELVCFLCARTFPKNPTARPRPVMELVPATALPYSRMRRKHPKKTKTKQLATA